MSEFDIFTNIQVSILEMSFKNQIQLFKDCLTALQCIQKEPTLAPIMREIMNENDFILNEEGTEVLSYIFETFGNGNDGFKEIVQSAGKKMKGGGREQDKKMKEQLNEQLRMEMNEELKKEQLKKEQLNERLNEKFRMEMNEQLRNERLAVVPRTSQEKQMVAYVPRTLAVVPSPSEEQMEVFSSPDPIRRLLDSELDKSKSLQIYLQHKSRENDKTKMYMLALGGLGSVAILLFRMASRATDAFFEHTVHAVSSVAGVGDAMLNCMSNIGNSFLRNVFKFKTQAFSTDSSFAAKISGSSGFFKDTSTDAVLAVLILIFVFAMLGCMLVTRLIVHLREVNTPFLSTKHDGGKRTRNKTQIHNRKTKRIHNRSSHKK